MKGANGILTIQLAPSQIVVALSLEFADELRTPRIEASIVRLETRIRAQQPQVMALLVKPQTQTSFDRSCHDRSVRACQLPTQTHQLPARRAPRLRTVDPLTRGCSQRSSCKQEEIGDDCSPSTERDAIVKKLSAKEIESLKLRQAAPLVTPTDLKTAATKDIAGAMNAILADVFAMYLKTKNFHWHMSGPHFRDYHLMLDEQADQLYAMTDPIAERIRKIGRPTLRSIGHIGRSQRVLDNDADYVEPLDMLAELREDNKTLAERLREVHGVCDEHGDIATASLIEVWIDETEKRTWFLFEASRQGDATGH